MNTKKLQSCLNCFSVIKFVKGLYSDEILPQWLLQTMHVALIALVPPLLHSNR